METELFDAVSRLTSWIRDFGNSKQPAFVDDLTRVLDQVRRSAATGEPTDIERLKVWNDAAAATALACQHLLNVQAKRLEELEYQGQVRIQRLVEMEVEVNRAREEIDRLKAGRFTEEEFQNLCHDLKPDDLRRFRAGCDDYQAKLFGLRNPKDEVERQRLKRCHDGLVELCCECGREYPRGDLIIDGEVTCPDCRSKQRPNCLGGNARRA